MSIFYQLVQSRKHISNFLEKAKVHWRDLLCTPVYVTLVVTCYSNISNFLVKAKAYWSDLKDYKSQYFYVQNQNKAMPKLKRVNGNSQLGSSVFSCFPTVLFDTTAKGALAHLFQHGDNRSYSAGRINWHLQPIGALEVFTSQSQEQCRGISQYSYAI